MHLVATICALALAAGGGSHPPGAVWPGQPSLLVLADGEVLRLLGAELGRGADDWPAYSVSFSPRRRAGTNALAARDAAARDAERIFEVMRAWAATKAANEIRVTAVIEGTGPGEQAMTLAWRRTAPTAWERGARKIHALDAPAPRPVLASDRDRDMEAATLEAATAFLALLDAGRLVEAWSVSAHATRAAVDQDIFRDLQEQQAALLGPVLTRRHLFWSYVPQVVGAIGGELVGVRFATTTEGGEGFDDVVVLRERDGAWRVAGHFQSAPRAASTRPLVDAAAQP